MPAPLAPATAATSRCLAREQIALETVEALQQRHRGAVARQSPQRGPALADERRGLRLVAVEPRATPPRRARGQLEGKLGARVEIGLQATRGLLGEDRERR